MLAIRLQRTGRKGHAQFRVVVQDSRQSPKSGRVVAGLGSYDPHTKTLTFDKDRAQTFIKNGAHPSDKVVRLLQAEGVKMPDWITVSADNKRAIRNPEKLRRNRPPEPKAEKAAEEVADTAQDAPAEPAEPAKEVPTEDQAAASEEAPTEPAAETPPEAETPADKPE